MMKTSWVLVPIAGLIAFALGGVVAVTEDTPSPQAKTSVRSQRTIPEQNEAATAPPSPSATEVEADELKDKDEGPGEKVMRTGMTGADRIGPWAVASERQARQG